MARLVDPVLDFVTSEPALVVIVVAILLFLFFGFLLVRRTLMSAREGYESGYNR